MVRIKEDNNYIKATLINDKKEIKAKIVNDDNSIKANITSVNSATTEKKGIIRIATDEEAIEGIANDIAITPHTLRLATHFVFEQSIASDTWIIEHNLNKQPDVTIVDSSGGKRMPDDIKYDSENQITVKFLAPFGGKAYLN